MNSKQKKMLLVGLLLLAAYLFFKNRKKKVNESLSKADGLPDVGGYSKNTGIGGGRTYTEPVNIGMTNQELAVVLGTATPPIVPRSYSSVNKKVSKLIPKGVSNY